MSRQSHNVRQLRERRRALRHNATLTEKRLWKWLRRRQLDGWRWRRQYSVGSFVLDFFCPEARLAVELDGAVHADPARAAYDGARERWLREKGIRVLRVENRTVAEQPDLVIQAIREELARHRPRRPPPGLPPLGGGD